MSMAYCQIIANARRSQIRPVKDVKAAHAGILYRIPFCDIIPYGNLKRAEEANHNKHVLSSVLIKFQDHMVTDTDLENQQFLANSSTRRVRSIFFFSIPSM